MSWVGVERKTGNCEKVTKEVIGIHFLLTRSLFGGGFLRGLLFASASAQ